MKAKKEGLCGETTSSENQEAPNDKKKKKQKIEI